MTQTSTSVVSPSVTVNDAGPSRKRLTIEVPADTVAQKIRDSLAALAVEAQLPGFRRGHVPLRLLERRFGSDVREQAKKEIVASAYARAVEDLQLRVVGEPQADLDAIDIREGQPLVFSVDVEVVPQFALPPLDNIPVYRPLLEVTDEMVAAELEKWCINEGRLEPRDVPEPGDYLTGHGVMRGPQGQEFYNIPGCVVRVPLPEHNGEGMILGIRVPDFERQLGRPRVGETATIRTRGPEQHEMEGVRNADLTITFKVDRIDRIIPATVADLVRQFGMSDEAQLRDAVRTRLYQRVMIQQQAAMRQQVARYLLDRTDMELPERLTAQQAARILQRHRLEMMYRGVDPAVIEQELARLRSASDETARLELKLSFILARAAEELNVGVSEAEVSGRIAQMAAERNVRPEAMRQQLIQSGQIGGVAQQIREHKTLDAILARAAITDVSAQEYERLAAEAAQARRAAGTEPAKPPASQSADESPPPSSPSGGTGSGKARKTRSNTAEKSATPRSPRKKS